MTNLQNGTMEMDNESFSANNFIKEKLRENILSVKFVKKDGTERKMRCTLRGDMIPVLQESTEVDIEDIDAAQKRTRSAENLAVWDLEKNAWRSFRYDSIIGFSEDN